MFCARVLSMIGILSIAIAMFEPSHAQAARNYTSHSGYVSTVEGERTAFYEDMRIIKSPYDAPGTLQARIFNEALVREFRERYEEKFGRTEVERVWHSPNRFSYYNDLYGFKGTDLELNDERRRYAEFMLRRLAEYHIDHYAQNDPQMRVVWEAKEQLKEMKVEVAQYRFDMQYSIAGNTFDMKVYNPYFSTARVRLQMDPGVIGPANIDETIVSLGNSITRTVSAEAHYHSNEGIISLVSRKQLRGDLSSSLTLSTFTHEGGRTKRESLYLAGAAYSF